MNFALLVTAGATQSPAAFSCLQFAEALLRQGHTIALIFFYGDGVYHAQPRPDAPTDEPNLADQWQQLIKAGIPLGACQTACRRRGIQSAFPLMNLSQWFLVAGSADRVVQF